MFLKKMGGVSHQNQGYSQQEILLQISWLYLLTLLTNQEWECALLLSCEVGREYSQHS
jgi:hypothetical protein